jgi:CarboxypepD_reg-like domain
VGDRISLYGIYFFLIFSLAFNAHSQNLSREISVDFENWPMKRVLEYLTFEHGLIFSYSDEIINSHRTISLTSQKLSIKIILKEIFDQTDLEHEFIGRQIVLRRKSGGSIVKVSIGGEVIDALTKKPLVGANVFFNNSTNGTFTDADGKFLLAQIPIDNDELVVSYLGYKTLYTRLNLNPSLHPHLLIKLLPATEELDEVVVKAKYDAQWLRDFELFKREFLGQTPNAGLCEILNPEVLRFYRRDGTLFIKANQPIQIQNQALGYRINLSIETCSIRPKEGYSFVFHSQFNPIEPVDTHQMIRWEVNRLQSYLGSETHFFRALVEHSSYRQGFDVYQKTKAELIIKDDELIVQSSFSIPFEESRVATDSQNQKATRVFEKGQYLVKYVNSLIPRRLQSIGDSPYPTSMIEVKSKELMVNGGGFVLSSLSDYTRDGYMSNQRIADKLPNEFDPSLAEFKITQYIHNRLGIIDGVILDSLTRAPIAEAEVFINNSTIHAKTSRRGEFAFIDIPKGEHDLIVYKSGHKIMRKKVLVEQNKSLSDTLFLAKNLVTVFSNIKTQDHDFYLAPFRHQLIGRQLSNQIKIENEKDILVNKQQDGNVSFSVTAPLEISYKQTGYKVKFFLRNAIQITGSNNTWIEGNCYFENLDTLFENTSVEINRLEAYEGSLLNFTRAIQHGRSKEEGFTILYKNDSSSTIKSNRPSRIKKGKVIELIPEKIILTETGNEMAIALPHRFEVIHLLPNMSSRKKSIFFLKAKIIIISGFGISSPTNEFEIEGDMKETSMIPALPIDYRLPKVRPLRQF